MDNRKINFRAWDTTFSVMLENIVVWDSDAQCIAVLDQPAQWAYGDKLDERMELNFEGSVPEWYCFTGGFKIMQSTGLFDKNAVEIFEGDLLREVPANDWDKTNFCCYEVFFHGGDANSDYNIGFSMARTHYHGSLCGGYIPSFKPKTVSKMIVCGNIFENPELLSK